MRGRREELCPRGRCFVEGHDAAFVSSIPQSHVTVIDALVQVGRGISPRMSSEADIVDGVTGDAAADRSRRRWDYKTQPHRAAPALPPRNVPPRVLRRWISRQAA